MNASAENAAPDPAVWVSTAAREAPQRVFLRAPAGAALTYAQLREHSGRAAAALTACGVSAGARVLVRAEKSAELVVLYVACLRLGAVFVPANPDGTPHEFEHLLRDCAPQLVLVPPQEAATLGPLIASTGAALATLGAQGEGSWPPLVARTPPAQLQERLPPEAVAAIVYTSGTTGRPKGAMLTRANLASNAFVLARAWHFSPADELVHVLPLFHVHGLFVAINTVLASGAGLTLMPRFEPAAVVAQLAAATVFMGVPTHYVRLLQEPTLGRGACAGMRLFVSGSAPLLPETHRAFAERTGHTILERYGMTETLMSTSNPYDGARVPGSVGPALPGVSVRLARAPGGAAADEEVGVLEVRGPNVFAGYFGDPARTAAEFSADGWFRTGDLARIDARGYVWIVGRAKDLVISGGFNVYPREVETELDAVPGVLESAVFGVPHADFGEGVTAAVVLRPGARLSEDELVQAVRARLSAYKVPKRVLVVAELPRNTMGKVRKDALRAEYAGLYRGR